jgi:predicted amidohydrolase YtcJ
MNAIYYNCSVYPRYRVHIRERYRKHRRIDLGGRVVIPGLVDSHTHFHFWAATLDTVHLDGIPAFEEALRTIKEYSDKRKSGEWIIGDGWSADRWSEYHLPTAEELDKVTGGRPAALYSKDQHIMWANSRALQLAGIDEKTPEPEGGKIDRYPDTGQPTGILREVPAYFPVFRLLNRPDRKHLDQCWKKATRMVYARGVTGFHSVDGPEAWDYFQRLHRKKNLGFRVHYYFPVAMLEDLIEKQIVTGMGDKTLRVGGVKIFCDGSLGAQTALMKKPYRGNRTGTGVEVIGLKKLKQLAARAVGGNLACAIHAIGDRAVANVISAYESVERKPHLRHRIEHLQIISRSDISRLMRTGAVASMQPSHCPSDRELVASYWGSRGRNAYIFKTLLEKNIPLAFGSDCPIEPLDPWAGIHAAVNRTGYGERGGRFYPEECLTVAQAVYGFTAGAAYAAGREDFSGKIAPGYQADMAILDDDIYRLPPSRLYKTKVAATVFGGKIVYHSSSIKAFG